MEALTEALTDVMGEAAVKRLESLFSAVSPIEIGKDLENITGHGICVTEGFGYMASYDYELFLTVFRH
ncbi:hypothetical protein ACS0TY_032022 [Phlomoides rotata]